MTTALSPELALAYLRELQPSIKDAAIGPPGERFAGEPEVVRVRSGNQEIAALPGPKGLPGLLAHDASRVAEVLKA
jgi:hypothetical protein